MSSWTKAVPCEDVYNGPVVFKVPPKQVALFYAGGAYYAVDNRCPHEGYPLSEGQVDEGCLLTCNWHNWKFQLRDGANVLGGDDVRAYATKVEDGYLWVDLADPTPEAIEAKILAGLQVAFEKDQFDRICRELTRLRFNDLDPMTGVRKAIEWSHDRFEFGFLHSYAATADWLTMAKRFEDDWEPQLICLAESIDHMADDALRHPQYPYPGAGETFEAEAFVAAVEAEQDDRAVGMVMQGLADGLHWPDMQAAFAEAALAHYNDFGHSLIYTYKTGQLIDHLGPDVERFVLPTLARHLCYTTREDLIPEFNHYAPALAALQPAPSAETRPSPPPLPFPATIQQALDWVVEHAPHHAPEVMYDRLLESSARNLLHYDTGYDTAYHRPVADNVSWLGFTHGITFANAVRSECASKPHLWPAGLLQMACFVGRNRRYLDLTLAEAAWEVADADAFFGDVHELLLDHGMRQPIFSAHLVKTAQAVREELDVASDTCRHYLLASLNRFLHASIKQKHVRRDRLTNPNLEFTLFTDRSLSFNTATRLLLLDLQALAALERA